MSSSAPVVIIDSGGANLASVVYAFDRLGIATLVTHDAATIRAAERVLLPGVGNATAIMARLNAHDLVPVIRSLTCPLLGICLGMQLLFERSAEGNTTGLGVISGSIHALQARPELPAPHMGWNTLRRWRDDALLEGCGETDWFYFVHNYIAPAHSAYTLATTEYGEPFSSVVRHNNFWGVQFHPERSGQSGARLLQNFVSLPSCA